MKEDVIKVKADQKWNVIKSFTNPASQWDQNDDRDLASSFGVPRDYPCVASVIKVDPQQIGKLLIFSS